MGAAAQAHAQQPPFSQTVLDQHFLASGDYKQIQKAAELQSMVGGRRCRRTDRRATGKRHAWRASSKPRLAARQARANLDPALQGLGRDERRATLETTMDPKVRRLLKVQIEDAIAADEIFTTH